MLSTGSHLDLVATMMQEFTHAGGLEAMARHGLRRVSRHLAAEASALYLVDETAGRLVCRAALGALALGSAAVGEPLHTGQMVDWGEGIVGRCAVFNRPWRESYHPPLPSADGMALHSALVVPLTSGGERFGAVLMLNKLATTPDATDTRRPTKPDLNQDTASTTPRAFTRDDQRLLVALAAAAGLAMRNARMASQLAAQYRWQRELELAADIQHRLLPPPRPDSYPVHGQTRPFSLVSGDFYDVVERADGWIWATAADVAGKGMNSALLMAKTASLFRCLAKEALSPGRLLARISDELSETSAQGMFVTMVCLAYHPPSGEVIVANAGHEAPLRHCLHDNRLQPLPGATAPPLGIFAGMHPADGIPEQRLTLTEGERLLVLTDGLTDIVHHRQRLGEARVQDWVRACAPAMPSQVPSQVLESLLADDGEQRDDMTLLVLQHGTAQQSCWTLTVTATPESLRLVRQFIRLAGQAVPLPAAHLSPPSESWLADLVLAVDEAAQNIIRHGYRGATASPLRLTLGVGPLRDGRHGLWVTIEDQAPPIPPSLPQTISHLRAQRPEPDVSTKPGGLGLMLLSLLSDDLCWQPASAGYNNCLWIGKALDCHG